MNIIGLSAYYHDAACCLLRDGKLVAAVEEERLSRIKHDARLPVASFRQCLAMGGLAMGGLGMGGLGMGGLDVGGLDITDIDAIAYYEQPARKRERQLQSGADANDLRLDASRPERAIRELLGWDGPIYFAQHHLAHAASAYYASGFAQSAVLTADGVGECTTTSYSIGQGSELSCFAEIGYPHSLGLFYSTLTAWLGFAVNDAEYKIMGLAAYGQPRYLEAMQQLLIDEADGGFSLQMDYFAFQRGARMYSQHLSELLGRIAGAVPRVPSEPISQVHADIARSAQLALEELLLTKLHWLHARTGSENLCLAGGVALNVVANGRIRRESPFARLFVPPAPGDSGACIGAAALAHVALTGRRPRISEDGTALRSAGFGPQYCAASITRLMATSGLKYVDYRSDCGQLVALARDAQAALLEAVVDRLQRGAIIGWFHGPAEFGPRALGARSLLADPRHPGMRERLNRVVKRREEFRPFAPSVLAAEAATHFDLDHASPFMSETCAVRSPLALPAITHVDGSARPQTVEPEVSPRYAALIAAFQRRTGCALLLNTSFNVAGEPIVATPEDALRTFAGTAIDALVLEDVLIDRADLSADWLARVHDWWPRLPAADADSTGLCGHLYSFV